MEIIKLDGLILKSFPFSETSRIIHLLTSEGKLAAMAKGANRPKSKFAGRLEPIYRVQAILQRKESRNMDMLTEIEILDPYKNLVKDFEKIVYANAIIETAGSLFYEGQDIGQEYEEIAIILHELNDAKSSYINYLFFFLHTLIKYSGFNLALQRCQSCEKEKISGPVKLDMQSGDYTCSVCLAEKGEKANMHNDRLLALRMISEKIHPVINFNRQAEEKILNFYLSYIRTHWQSDFKIKSLELLNNKR